MKFLSCLVIFLSCLFACALLLPYAVKAEYTFSDNFNDGNIEDWTVVRNNCQSDWLPYDGKYGIEINIGCVTETLPNSLLINDGISYRYEVDMLMKNSVDMDRNFVFKYLDQQNWYGIHTYKNNVYLHKVVNGNEYFLDNWHTYFNFEPDATYNFKVEIHYNHFYKIYINDNLQAIVPDKTPFFSNHKAGLQASAGGAPSSNVWFDNFAITEIVEASPSPTPTNSPSPSPTPSPTASPTTSPTVLPSPTYISFDVPSLKQYSLPWKNVNYDHIKGTINEYGCALTSAAMVLQYYGHDITPDKLNTWLKNQPDGYLRNGLVNWLAISRFTKEKDSITSPTLEYLRLEPTNENLINEIINKRPVILKEPGHFVVAKGQTSDSFSINDPGYESRNDLTYYGNKFLAINSYIPTHSDLSYIMMVIDSNKNVTIKDSFGNIVDAQEYIEEPITNLSSPDKKSGDSIKIIILPKPKADNYKMEVQGNGNYKIDSYLYDTRGKVVQQNFSGKLTSQSKDIYNVSFKSQKDVHEETKYKNIEIVTKILKYIFSYPKR